MDLSAFSWVNLSFLFEGLWVTIQVSVLSIIFSFVIGAVLGTLRFARIPVLSQVVAILVDVIRNLPLLLIIFFTYFALPQIGIRFDIFWSAIVALTIFESAMIAEIVRGGLESVDPGQMEAARSTGLGYWQGMIHVVIPQALRSMVPPIVSQLIALIKDTSLAVVIALPELTHNAKIIYSQNSNYVIPMFVAMTVLYFLVCFVLSRLTKRLELKA